MSYGDFISFTLCSDFISGRGVGIHGSSRHSLYAFCRPCAYDGRRDDDRVPYDESDDVPFWQNRACPNPN